MNSTLSRTEWQRIEHWLIWIAAIGILFFILVPLAADKMDAHRVAVEHRILPPQSVALPFTAWNVAEYFSTSLEMSVDKKANGRLVFENQHAIVPEDFWHVEIWPESDSVVVQFTVGGDYGMSMAREFFECPLFERRETEALYEMLSDAQNSPVSRLPRFTVSMTYRQQTHLQMLNLKFLPPARIGKD